MSWAMGREPHGNAFTEIEKTEDYVSLLILAQDAVTFVKENAPERVKERFLVYVRTPFGHIANNSTKSSEAAFQSVNFTPENIERLRVVAEALANADNEKIVSQEEINEMLSILDEMITFIQNCSIDDRLRARILKTLGLLRTELTRINIVGPEEAIKYFDTILGEGARSVLTSENEEQHRDGLAFLAKAAKAAEHMSKVTDFTVKVWPMLTVGLKALSGG